MQNPEIYELFSPAMAKGYRGSMCIEVCKNYNGSGGTAFGGADSWPVLVLQVPFQVGEEAKRERLIEKLKECLNDFD